MDPIKVDFSSDNSKSGGSKVVIPPEKKMLRMIISIVVTLIAAAIGYYFYLPALNFKCIDMYIYLAAAIIVYCVVNYLMSGALRTPDYAPYARKSIRIPIIILVVGAIIVAGGFAISSVFFRAKSYHEIIDIQEGNFEASVENSFENGFGTVPRIDSDTTAVLAERALGELSSKGYVSQFTVEPSYNQINYKNQPYRLATLKYSNIIKWFTNSDERIPAFIKIDTLSQEAKLCMVEGGLQYSTADHFSHNVKRQLRFKYPTYIFDTPQFEIDDKEHPYWIAARLDKTIGLFGGTDVIGVVICDAVSGECTEYSMEQIKNDKKLSWIDRVYSAELLVDQYNYYGRYENGFWNSILGQKGTTCTTEGYSYLALGDDVYLYTGVTALTSDESLTGFTLINMRTKEAKYYKISGAKESSAQTSAEGLVQQYGYTASFPLLLNVNGISTYFMPMKDSSNLVKMYAMVNVGQSSVGGYGTTFTECYNNYHDVLVKNKIIDKNAKWEDTENNIVDTDTDTEKDKKETVIEEVNGKITDIRTAVIGGDTVYYIKLDSSENFYKIKAASFEQIVTYDKGSTVTISFEKAVEEKAEGEKTEEGKIESESTKSEIISVKEIK